MISSNKNFFTHQNPEETNENIKINLHEYDDNNLIHNSYGLNESMKGKIV